MTTETKPLAIQTDTTAMDTTLAERYVREHMETYWDDAGLIYEATHDADCECKCEEGAPMPEPLEVAERVVGGFTASIERANGLRWVVLRGKPEVDPLAR